MPVVLKLLPIQGDRLSSEIAQGNGYKQHALKGQKLLAQGIALGIMAIRNAPCKVGCSKFESKIRYKKWCYFGAAKLLIFNTLIYEIVL